MRKILTVLFLELNICFLSAQIIYKTEGTTFNNALTGNWEGINIPRTVPTKLSFLNNSITSVNSSGYLLQAGDEAPLSTNNNLNEAIITGNRFSWNGTILSSIITHGLFYGYNINGTIKYNYLNNVPYGIILKSGTDAGVNMSFTSGGVAYNIVKNGHFALRLKGINGVKVYNNTFYSGDGAGWYLVLITENMDRTKGAPSLGTRLFNNIFYTKYKIPSIKIDLTETLNDFQCDYNIYYCEEGDHTPVFLVGNSEYSWAEWRALGYDTHSFVVNPKFNDFNSFVPFSRLNYGTNLGIDWQTGLSTNAKWITGSSPATTNQNGTWQAGAMIYPEPTAPVTPVSPVNSPPVAVVNAPSENLSGFVGAIDASGSYDPNNDKLTFTWTPPENISVSSVNGSKILFLSPVVISAKTVEFTLKLSDGKTTLLKTVPVEIVPYKPELEIAEVLNLEASGFQSPYYPFNILDGNIGTMWAASGDNQWLTMELKGPFNIQHVKIAFQSGQKKESYFDILGSDDKVTWEPILNKSASCGFSGDLQVFEFPESKTGQEFRYIKLIGHSNSVDSWNYISEFKIFGYKHRNPSEYDGLPVKLYPNPAHEFVNIRIDKTALKPDFIRIINMAGKIVIENRMDPDTKELLVPLNLKQGIYIVEIGIGNIPLFTQKLVVNI